MKNIFSDSYYGVRYFFKKFSWIRVYNSPFKPPRLKWYFGKISIGTPYYLPRKWRTLTWEECVEEAEDKNKRFNTDKFLPEGFKSYKKPIPVKWFWVDVIELGWKTKWREFRFEYAPMISIVLFKRQLVVKANAKDETHFWECWLTYTYDTDKTKSVAERILEARKKSPCVWISTKNGEEVRTCYWDVILKKKYMQ